MGLASVMDKEEAIQEIANRIKGNCLSQFVIFQFPSSKFFMDQSSILSWNVRGLSSTIHEYNVRNLVITKKSGMVCIQETKSYFFIDLCKRAIRVYDFSCQAEVPAIGLFGGLITFWDLCLFAIKHVQSQRHWIWVRGKNTLKGTSISVFNITLLKALKKRRSFGIS